MKETTSSPNTAAHPDASKAQLGYYLMRHAGEYVNAKAVQKIARELVGDSH